VSEIKASPAKKKTPKNQTKRADRVGQGIGPEFKPQYHKKNPNVNVSDNLYLSYVDICTL
jgi:hypothetical protein